MNTIKNAPLALVTGASRGIGRAIAEALAEAGYHLILTCSHTLPDLQEVAACLEEKYGITCTAMAADASKPAAIEKVFASLDHLDVLVNNAGISYIGLLTDMSVEEWQHVLNTNLSSCFYTSRLAVPLMLLKHSGRIINISSVWGNVGASMEVAYSASKGGVNSFTKALAKELAPSNIQVNAISCDEPLLLRRGNERPPGRDSRRPSGPAGGSRKTCPPAHPGANLSHRTDPYP